MTICAAIGVAQNKGAQASATTSNSADLPEGWQVYKLGSKGSFNVALPGKPETESENLKSGDFTMKAAYYNSSSNDIVTVLADIYDLPINSGSLTEKDKLYLFQKVREGFAKGIKSELEKTGFKAELKFYEQKSVTLKGISGYEQAIGIGNLKGKTRMLSNKDHIYIFFTLLLEDSKENLISDFLDSFEYIGAR